MAPKQPLEGIRVADFTWVWAGPFCTLQLAHLGAEVIRIETSTRICVTRLLPPWADGEFGVNRSGYFNQYNQGKRSLALDLKQPGAIDIAKQLVGKCDVVCENFAAGVMDRMGLGYEVLRAIKPDLIMIALSGYGASGPESQFVSYGPAQVPLSGLSSVTGYRDWPPMHVGISYGDPNGGLHGAVAVLAALHHRARTGRGQYIDLSQQETTISILPEAVMEYTMNGTQPVRDGNRDPHMAPHGVFRCAGQERWIAIAVRNDSEWRRIAEIMGNSAWGDDPRFATIQARKANEDALEALVAEWTATRAAEDVVCQLQAAGIPSFVSASNRDLSESPHLSETEFFVSHPHPEVGTRQHAGIPWRMSRTPSAVRSAAPCLGADTDYVMRDVLGYAPDAIARLKETKVLN
ncbi:MAG TPA: CoA transferase [Candidatus Binatia bacterium]|nr:CoA transferase [Candidatus Binatia bacterium]